MAVCYRHNVLLKHSSLNLCCISTALYAEPGLILEALILFVAMTLYNVFYDAQRQLRQKFNRDTLYVHLYYAQKETMNTFAILFKQLILLKSDIIYKQMTQGIF